jgi:hypothetical protein
MVRIRQDCSTSHRVAGLIVVGESVLLSQNYDQALPEGLLLKLNISICRSLYSFSEICLEGWYPSKFASPGFRLGYTNTPSKPENSDFIRLLV